MAASGRRSGGWLVGLALAWLFLAAGTIRAEDQKPYADDACTSKCDNDSDQCMRAAAGDKNKTKACDDQYEDCLKKCG